MSEGFYMIPARLEYGRLVLAGPFLSSFTPVQSAGRNDNVRKYSRLSCAITHSSPQAK